MTNNNTERHNVLCQCGWGHMAVPEDEIPELCPVCGFNFWEHAEYIRECEAEFYGDSQDQCEARERLSTQHER